MSLVTPSADEAPALARRKFFGDLRSDPDSKRLEVGSTLRVSIRAKAFGGRDVKPRFVGFASGDDAIVTVDSTGLVTARAVGKTVVRVWANSPNIQFNTDSVLLEVRLPEVPTTVTEPESLPAETSSGESSTPPPTETTNSASGDSSSGSTSSGETSGSTGSTGSTTSGTTSTTTAPQPPPPPSGTPATSAGFPNQPSGMYIMTDRQFDSKAKDNNDRGATGSDGWDGIEYRYGKFTIVNDPTAPSGDGLVGQMYYPANHTAGTAPATAQTLMWSNAPRQLYISVWAKISSNWVGNQSSTNKMLFIGVSGG
ncbi:MAG TPA: Ig-like domain-containing protein, partial [Gemmatimonadaceae bacterium]|nr:Ig-like domain-containing protein [Gemmatimonadaceae bacterium]